MTKMRGKGHMKLINFNCSYLVWSRLSSSFIFSGPGCTFHRFYSSNPDHVKKLVPFVGKDSHYSRKIAAHYLSKFKGRFADSPSKFKRDDPDILNENSVTKYQNLANLREISDKNLSSSTKTFEILALLRSLRDFEVTKGLEPSISVSYDPIPSLPSRFNALSFAQYIHSLCYVTYYRERASFPDQIVTRLIRDLMSAGNNNTKPFQQNVDVFNDVIYYFQKRKDLASMLEFYYQMFTLRLVPTTRTLNMFLAVVPVFNSMPHNYNSPYSLIVKYLQLFEKYQLKPNTLTYQYAYEALPDFTSKIMFLEFMKEQKIAVSKSLLKSIIADLATRMSSDETIAFFANSANEYSFKDMDVKCFNIIIDQVLDEGIAQNGWNFVKAWDLFIKYATNPKYPSITPKLSSLRMFLSRFAARDRVDLAIAATNTFEKHFKVLPDIHVYKYLTKASVKAGFQPNWRQRMRIIYQEGHLYTRGSFMRLCSYWLRRARARSLMEHEDKNLFKSNSLMLKLENENKYMLKFNTPLSEEEITLSKQIKQNVVWDDFKLPMYPTKDTVSEQYYNLVRDMVGNRILPPEMRPSFVKKTVNKGIQQRYLKRVKHLALGKIYKARTDDIVLGPERALRNNMEKRGLVEVDSKVLEVD